LFLLAAAVTTVATAVATTITIAAANTKKQ
jgi:hypothetical protein